MASSDIQQNAPNGNYSKSNKNGNRTVVYSKFVTCLKQFYNSFVHEKYLYSK